jgi:O-antigen ligase
MMDREQLDDWCEKGVLGLVLAILIYSPLAFGTLPQLGFDYFVVVEWLTVGILAVWLARFWINPKHRLLWPPVCWPVAAFIIYAVARYLTADVEFLARQEMIKVLVYGVLFFAIVNNLHRQETTQIVGLTLIFLAMLLSLYAVYQFLTTSDYALNLYKPEGYRKRGSGTFISPNNLAGYLGMVLPLALAFTITGRFEHLSKIFLGYASIAIFTGIASTISRAGWLATGVGLLVLYFWLMRQRDFRKQAVLFLFVLGAIFMFVFWRADMPPERKERFDVAAQVEDVRFKLWQPAIKMWRDHVWFGVGPNHFDYRFRQYRPADAQLQTRPDRVHNDYLNTLTDWGLAGGVLVLLCWSALCYQILSGWKYVKRSQNDLGAKRSNKAAFVAGGAIGLLTILVHSVFDFNMHVPANAILAVTLMALVAAHYRFASERYWHTVRLPLRIPIMVVLSAALAYLGPQAWKRSLESYWLAKGVGKVDSTNTRVAAFRHAWNAENQNFETAYQIGEALWQQSLRGAEGYEVQAREAITWFEKSVALNRYNPHPLIRSGMCLDWIGEHAAAATSFEKAEALDPNGYYTEAHVGWHYFQIEDYVTAKRRFERSLSLFADEKLNPIPHSYLKKIAERQKELLPGN